MKLVWIKMSQKKKKTNWELQHREWVKQKGWWKSHQRKERITIAEQNGMYSLCPQRGLGLWIRLLRQVPQPHYEFCMQSHSFMKSPFQVVGLPASQQSQNCSPKTHLSKQHVTRRVYHLWLQCLISYFSVHFDWASYSQACCSTITSKQKGEFR